MLLLAGLVCVGFAIRWKTSTNGGLWRDEALCIFVAQLPSWRDTLEFLRLHESHPPLFYALLRGWISLFGDGEHSKLLLPVLFGTAQIPVVYIAGELFFSRRAGLAAAMLVSVAPALVEYSGVIRPYSFLPFAVLVGAIFLVLAMEKGEPLLWAGFGLSLLAVLLTHNWGVVVAVGYLAAVLSCIPLLPRLKSRTLLQAAVAFGICALAYLPWFSVLLFQSKHAGYAPLEFHGLFGSLRIIAFTFFLLLRSTFVGSVSADEFPIIIGSLIVAAAIGVAGFGQASKSSRRVPTRISESLSSSIRARIAIRALIVIVAVALVTALALSVRSNLMIVRCVVMLSPLIIVVVAHWISIQWSRLNLVRGGKALALACAIMLLGNQVAALSLLLRRPRSNARELARTVTKFTRKDDLVIIAPVWLASSFNYYYTLQVPQFDFPDSGRQQAVNFASLWQRVASRRALARLQNEILQANSGNRRVWLVTDMESLQPLSPADTSRALNEGDFETLGALRVGDIRAFLREQYGPAADSLGISEHPARFEQLVAFLYSPTIANQH